MTSPAEDFGGIVTNSVSTCGSTAENNFFNYSLDTSPSWSGIRYLSSSIFSGFTFFKREVKYSSFTNQEQLLLVNTYFEINYWSSLKELVRCFRNFHPNPNDADLQFSRMRYCTLTLR